jgi:enterochelin esterase family protein
MSNTNGIWSATTPPLSPEIYWYSFNVDGHDQLDPYNKVSLPNYFYLDSVITVPGPKPQLWEVDNIPHGAVSHHFYTSKLMKGLPNGQSEYYVYTPPGYDPAGKQYPTLYLLHGFSMMASDWTYPGGANFILDHLIAQGKAQPMVVVMPLSYGVVGSPPTGDDSFYATWDNSDVLFSPVLLEEIMPRINAEYHVSKDRKMRAIAGLSMGGAESIMIGLNHPDQFAWIGGFSSGTHGNIRDHLPTSYKNADLNLIWISCGESDPDLHPNLELAAWMKQNNLPVTSVTMPGGHTWTVWHPSLIRFAPLLFQTAQ